MKSKFVVILVMIFFVHGCAFYPKVKEETKVCKVITKELKIEPFMPLKDAKGPSTCDSEACLALILPMLAVSTGTYLISGTIVIVGNTVHWLELKNQCPEEDWKFDPASDIKKQISRWFDGIMSV